MGIELHCFFTNRFTDRIVSYGSLSTILTANGTRHRTELPFWITRWFCHDFNRLTGHVTVRSFRFESLNYSVGKNPPRQRTAFFLILNISYVILSLTTDQMFPSVYTDGMTAEKISSIIATSNYRQKYSIGKSVDIKRISGSVQGSKISWVGV